MGQRNSTTSRPRENINPYDEKYWRSENLQTKREIGKGPNGYVLEALNIKTKIRCAVKILEYSTRDDPAYKYAFDKARRMYKINKWNNKNLVHTYICELIEVENNFSLKHKCAIIMDYFEQNLTTFINQKKEAKVTFNEQTLLKFTLNLTHGLSCAHKNGIFHTNIKDENVFYCPTSNVLKLGDFDIPGNNSKNTNLKSIIYQPPEIYNTGGQETGEVEIDWPKVDVYAAGIVMLKLALLKDNLNANERKALPELIVEVKKISEKLAEVLDGMLKPTPEERWSSEKCFKFTQSYYFQTYPPSAELEETLITQEQKEAKLLLEKGLLYRRSDDHRVAMNYFESAKNRIIESELMNYYDRVIISDCLNYSAQTYYELKDYVNALNCVLKCLDLKKKFLSKNEIWATYGNVGRIYIKVGDPQKGLYYYLCALRTLKKENAQTYNANAAKCYENIASTYESVGDFPNALENHLLAVEIVKKLCGDKHARYGKALRNVARVYKCMGNTEKSKEFEAMSKKTNL